MKVNAMGREWTVEDVEKAKGVPADMSDIMTLFNAMEDCMAILSKRLDSMVDLQKAHNDVLRGLIADQKAKGE